MVIKGDSEVSGKKNKASYIRRMFDAHRVRISI